MQHHRKILTSVVQFVPSRHPTLVVASPGRSGSSMLFIELARAMSKERFGVGSTYLKDFAWDLSAKKLRRGMVYKTHDYPDALYGLESVRCVFVFGSAIDTVISTLKQEKIKGQGWIAAHLAHLKLPNTLWESAARLKQSEPARELFGDIFVDHYAGTREWEEREFRKHISDWEMNRYFEII